MTPETGYLYGSVVYQKWLALRHERERPYSHLLQKLQVAWLGPGKHGTPDSSVPQVKVRCRAQHGRCAVPHTIPSLDSVKAHIVTNAQMHTGGRIYPLLNHRDLEDSLHYVSFPEKYLHFESRNLSQAGPSLFGRVGVAFDFS